MVRWLCADLAGEIEALAPETVRTLGRRRPGRVRYLIPLLVLGLLCWLLLNLTLPPIPGLLGGGAGGGAGAGGGGAGGAPPDEGQERPGEADPQPPQRLPEPLPLPEEPPPPPVVEQEPAPLLDLPVLPRIVVPQFIGDGPTRKAMAHRALVADEGGGVTPPPPPPAGRQGTELPPPAASQADEFARAAERAQRARHVPPEEQPMVRRFFELLQREAK
jgi:hypothetical protein